jgi:hypothetical protein
MKILFTFGTKQATLMRRSTVLILPLQLVFPGLTFPGKALDEKELYELNTLYFITGEQ